jgi:hypothetical protein
MCYTMDDGKFAAQREQYLDNLSGYMLDLVDMEYHELPWSCIFPSEHQSGTARKHVDNCNLTLVPATLCIDGKEYSYEVSVISKERVKDSIWGAVRCTVKNDLFGTFTLVLRRPAMDTVFCPALQAAAASDRQKAIASARANVEQTEDAKKFQEKQTRDAKKIQEKQTRDAMAAFASQFKTNSPKKSSGFKKFFKL